MYFSTTHLTDYPNHVIEDLKKDVKSSKSICLCRMLTPTLYVGRLVGFFPFTWREKNGKCLFERSIFWICYSVTILALLSFQIFHSIDFLNITKNKSLPILLSNTTDAIYGIYILILSSISLYRHPRWIRTLNNFPDILKEGIFCQSARKIVRNLQYGFLSVILLVMTVQAGILTYLHFSETYQSDFNYNIFINKTLQNISFVFYLCFLTMVSTFIGILACFEKLTISALKYTPVHPMKGINDTNSTQDFMGIFSYKLCKEEHRCRGNLAKLPQAEIVEFLRILHEEISLITYEINNCMNPQFLCHTVVELTLLIVEWYAVIVYVAYEFKAPMARTIHILNCLFVVMHTFGIFLFLKNAQQLKNMVQGLNNFLLEYSTRISSPEEHQQVRLFIEKLRQHRPFTASGVFTIDLGIAGPISANILTYVLVALQFEIPSEE